MTSYFIRLYYRLKYYFNNNNENITVGKRQRDNFEDNDDEYLSATKHKRAKWNTEPVSHLNMDSAGRSRSTFTSKQSCESVSKKQTLFNTNTKENVHDLTSDDDNDIEDITPIRAGSRPPLSPLPARHRAHSSKSLKKELHPSSTPIDKNGASTNSYHNNGRISTHLRVSKSSSSTSSMGIFQAKNSALNESIRLDEKRRYSEMLNLFLQKGSVARPIVSSPQLPKVVNQETQTSPFNMRFRNRHFSSVHVIDLTKGEDSHVPIRQAKPTFSRRNDVHQQKKKVERVNSFEEKLKSYNFVGPQWITEMQNRYGAKEREKRREVDEVLLVKDLYGKHNQIFNDALVERIQKRLAITEVVLDETEEVPTLPALTTEMEQRVKDAYISNPPGEVVAEGFGQRITRRDIYTLSKLNWLNDEVINFYMNLLIERGKNDNLPGVYAFNTFFYPKLASVGHNALKRWTKKVDIFAQSMVIVPVHLGMHWCLAVIDFRDKTIRYYDSMGSTNNRCLNALLKYLEDESLDKKKQPYDTTDWKLVNVKNIPQQMNGSDCGMFSCMFAEFISRNASITFTQDDMPYFRKKMTYEILTRKLLT